MWPIRISDAHFYPMIKHVQIVCNQVSENFFIIIIFQYVLMLKLCPVMAAIFDFHSKIKHKLCKAQLALTAMLYFKLCKAQLALAAMLYLKL